MKQIKVSGYIQIEDDEYDPGPLGPLTQDAHEEWAGSFPLEDILFELTEDDE